MKPDCTVMFGIINRRDSLPAGRLKGRGIHQAFRSQFGSAPHNNQHLPLIVDKKLA